MALFGGNKMRQLIVFSLDKENKPATEADRIAMLGLLHGIGLKVRDALGVYKGVAERSYMVEVTHKGEFALIKSLCIHFNQESVLAVNLENFEATLHFLMERGRKMILGHWVKTTQIEKEAMTLDLDTMQGYVVR